MYKALTGKVNLKDNWENNLRNHVNGSVNWERINNSVSMIITRWSILEASVTRATADLAEDEQEEGVLDRLARVQTKVAYHCPRAYTESDPSIINRGTGYVEPCNQTTHGAFSTNTKKMGQLTAIAFGAMGCEVPV